MSWALGWLLWTMAVQVHAGWNSGSAAVAAIVTTAPDGMMHVDM